MSSNHMVRTFALVAVAAGGLAALKALRLTDDAVRFVMLETPAYASPAESEGDNDAERDHAADPAEPAPVVSTPPSVAPAAERCDAVTIADRAGLTHAEIRVLRQLSERRRAIETREAELATQASLLEAAESRVEERVAELRGIRDEIEGLLSELDSVEEQDMSRLVALYERMEPRAAAPILANLDDDILFAVTSRMDETKLAPLLAAMGAADAVRVTMLLATSQERVREAETRLAEALGVEE